MGRAPTNSNVSRLPGPTGSGAEACAAATGSAGIRASAHADVRVPFQGASDGQRSGSGTRLTSTSSPAPRPVFFRVSALKDTRNRPAITPIVVL
jgi:hypothetical protein